MMVRAEVTRVAEIASGVKKIDFEWDAKVLPGQFLMLWYPGYGEIPISISHIGNPKSITVKEYGNVSKLICNMEKGNTIYFRGPYGNHFNPKGKKILLVGGGSGMASLHPLIGPGVYGIVAGRTSHDLVFLDEFDRDKVTVSTDDGSMGVKGNALDALKLQKLEEFTSIHVCGPEIMMFRIMEHLVGRDLNVEFSLERTMKCGIGICDSCSIDGKQLCRDGPVFHISELSLMKEFGESKLTSAGERVFTNAHT